MDVLVFRPHIKLEGLTISYLQVRGTQQAPPSNAVLELATRVLRSKSLIDAFFHLI